MLERPIASVTLGFWIGLLVSVSACSSAPAADGTTEDVKTGGRWIKPLKDGFYEGDDVYVEL